MKQSVCGSCWTARPSKRSTKEETFAKSRRFVGITRLFQLLCVYFWTRVLIVSLFAGVCCGSWPLWTENGDWSSTSRKPGCGGWDEELCHKKQRSPSLAVCYSRPQDNWSQNLLSEILYWVNRSHQWVFFFDPDVQMDVTQFRQRLAGDGVCCVCGVFRTHTAPTKDLGPEVTPW